MTKEDLLQAASQLSPTELEQFVTQINLLYNQRQTTLPPETQLLQTIQQPLPTDIQTRWDILIEKRQEETLTPHEYEELLQLTDRVEAFNLQRIEALAELAKLRGVDLPTLMRQIDFPTPSYA